MADLSDSLLLREYAERQSESAFGELVQRHVNFVYSVAMHCVGNPPDAQDVAQAVFVILARKSAGLCGRSTLTGWLYETTRLTTRQLLRTRTRRLAREQEAYMQCTLDRSGDDPLWRQLAPHLEEAMSRLRAADRELLALRFYENKTGEEAALLLGIGAAAAHKRTDRALNKLRQFFAIRGVSSTTTVIAGAISANSVQVAPAGLAKTISIVAVAKGAAAGSAILALTTKTLKSMAWAKMKFACGLAAGVLLAGSIVTFTELNPTVMDKASHERYQMEGDIAYHYYDYTTHAPSVEDIRHFVLIVNGPNWAVHLTDSQWHGIQYEEEVQLNGSVYWYAYFGKPASGGPVNTGGAVIEYGDFPVEDGSSANIVWVGLASPHYFAGSTNGDVVSLLNPSSNARIYKVKVQWQLNDKPPYLPKSIDFYEGPKEYMAAPFKNGWKNSSVRVLEETNIGIESFPITYTCEQFRPKHTGAVTSNDLDEAAIYTVNVSSVRLDSVPDVLTPKSDGTTAIGETRFPGNNTYKQILYFSTASRLPEKPEPEAFKQYKIQTESHLSRHTHKLQATSNHKWILTSSLIVFLGIVFSLMLIRRRQQN